MQFVFVLKLFNNIDLSMQLPKPYSCEQSSLFADNFLHAQLSFPQQIPKQQQNSEQLANPHESPRDILNPSSRLRFYQQHKKISVIAYHLFLQKKRQCELLDSLNKKIKLLQDRLRDSKLKDEKKLQLSEENKAKRLRRTAELIDKNYPCSAAYCSRSYGSEGSLQQHIKIKHPQLYQKNLQVQQDQSDYDDGSL